MLSLNATVSPAAIVSTTGEDQNPSASPAATTAAIAPTQANSPGAQQPHLFPPAPATPIKLHNLHQDAAGYYYYEKAIDKSATPSPPPSKLVKVYVTNFTARIAADIRDLDEPNLEPVFEIEVRKAGESKTIRVSPAEFRSLTWRLTCWADATARSTHSDQIIAAIQADSKDAERVGITCRTGWLRLNGRWAYRHGGGVIDAGPQNHPTNLTHPTPDPTTPIPNLTPVSPAGHGTGRDCRVSRMHVQLPDVLRHFHLPTPPAAPELIEALRKGRKMLEVGPKAVTYSLFAGVFRAPLGRSRFSQFLLGQTGQKKSCLAALAMQHYGAGFDYDHLPGNFYSTANYLEHLTWSAADAILVVDEYTRNNIDQENGEVTRVGARLARETGNNAGRGRMTSLSTGRPVRSPSCSPIFTGEDHMRGSVNHRMLIHDLTPDHIDEAKLGVCQADAAAGEYAKALSAYLTYLAPRLDEVHRAMQTGRAELRIEAAQALRLKLEESSKSVPVQPHSRLPDILADLALGLRCYVQFSVAGGDMTVDEGRHFFGEGWGWLIEAGRRHAEFVTPKKTAERFIELLETALVTGKAHIVGNDQGDAPPNPEAWGYSTTDDDLQKQPMGVRIGWIDATADRLYLFPDICLKVTEQIAGSRDDALNVSITTLGTHLKTAGHLAHWDQKRGTLKLRRTFLKEKVSVWCLKRSAFRPVADVTTPPKEGEYGTTCFMPGIPYPVLRMKDGTRCIIYVGGQPYLLEGVDDSEKVEVLVEPLTEDDLKELRDGAFTELLQV